MTGELKSRMTELAAHRVPFVHATVVRAQFPSSARAGDDAIVLLDGSIEGFVGGQCAEGSVRAAALGALADGNTVLLRVLPPGEVDFPESSGAQVVVNPCLSGGALEIFLQPLMPEPILWLSGRTPIADAIIDLSRPLGLEIRRAEDGQSPAGATVAILASHGRDELPNIRGALDAGIGFIGLVASRKRGNSVLAEMELTEDQRARIRTPVGLWIGARTASEVALSILAEVVHAVRIDRLQPAPPDGAVAAANPITDIPETDIPETDIPETDIPETDIGATAFAAARITPIGVAQTAIDPVCGMTVVIGPDTAQLTIEGEHFWFCGTGCRDRYAG